MIPRHVRIKKLPAKHKQLQVSEAGGAGQRGGGAGLQGGGTAGQRDKRQQGEGQRRKKLSVVTGPV